MRENTEKKKLNICYYEDDIEEITYYFQTNVTQEYINKLKFIGYWSDVKRWLIEGGYLVIELNLDNKN